MGDVQRGAVLANELKHGACKLAKWTVQGMLAGSDLIKFGYITRYQVKDSSRHVILGVQQFKPAEFGAQINLSMDNAWGIVRCIVDLVRKQKDGKYLIVKDPMKPVSGSTTSRTAPSKARTRATTRMRMTPSRRLSRPEQLHCHHEQGT